MSDYFKNAVEFTLKQEGGYVDDPRDSGGRTNMGITERTYQGWCYARGFKPVPIKDLDEITAEQIYLELFWQPYGLGAITRRAPAIAIFDAGVLFGPDVAAFRAQSALQQCGAALEIDCRIGPETCRAIEAFSPGKFLNAFRDQLEDRVNIICDRRPIDDAFRAGWMARIDRYPNLALGG